MILEENVFTHKIYAIVRRFVKMLKFKMINLLLAKMKMANKEHISSSGIAASQLLNCRTAHSIFMIAIPLNEDSICSINNNSKSGKLFRSCRFIVWDECTMTHNHAL